MARAKESESMGSSPWIMFVMGIIIGLLASFAIIALAK